MIAVATSAKPLRKRPVKKLIVDRRQRILAEPADPPSSDDDHGPATHYGLVDAVHDGRQSQRDLHVLTFFWLWYDPKASGCFSLLVDSLIPRLSQAIIGGTA